VDAKRLLDEAKARAESLGVNLEGRAEESSEEDEEDLVEVEDKEGFEEKVLEEDVSSSYASVRGEKSLQWSFSSSS